MTIIKFENLNPVYSPGPIDKDLMAECLANQKLTADKIVPMLPHGREGIVGKETRQIYFGLAMKNRQLNPQAVLAGESFTNDLPTTRIIGFGDCNVACPYCKRDCQFIDSDGNVIAAVNIQVRDLFGLADGAIDRGEIVRFSGGDPVKFPRETLAVAEYVYRRYGEKVSIAHNGSGVAWAKKLAPMLSSAAIDLKAVPKRMGEIMGVPQALGERLYGLSLKTQRIITAAGAILDVRTPVFGDTPLAEMMRLADDIAANDPSRTFWTWRMYKAVKGCDWVVPEKGHLFEMMKAVSAEFPRLWMGVRAKWQRGGMVYLRNGDFVNAFEAAEISDDEAAGSGNFEVIDNKTE